VVLYFIIKNNHGYAYSCCLRLVKGYYLGHYGKCFVFATKFKDRSQSPV
jgi:hypothetical protein